MKQLIILSLGLLLGYSAVQAQSLERQVLGTVGGHLVGTQVQLSSTGGEVATATLQGTLTLTQGFQQTTESEITAVEPTLALQYRLYPNPAQDWIQVELASDRQAELHWTLVDGLGRTLKQSAQPIRVSTSQQVIKIDLREQSAGVYYLQFRADDGSPSKAIAFIIR
ncbi:MAG: T9SS type A sorting domain-containing protein [Bacteroidota bacterium]